MECFNIECYHNILNAKQCNTALISVLQPSNVHVRTLTYHALIDLFGIVLEQMQIQDLKKKSDLFIFGYPGSAFLHELLVKVRSLLTEVASLLWRAASRVGGLSSHGSWA